VRLPPVGASQSDEILAVAFTSDHAREVGGHLKRQRGKGNGVEAPKP
jgi:hypothetical protein